jgi:hypothetical protein
MRLINVILINVMALSLFFSCSNDDNGNPVSGNGNGSTQIFIVWAEFSDSYWDDVQDEEIYTPNTDIDGIVTSDKLPTFDYYKVGDLKFEKYYQYFPGYISFGSEIDDEGYSPVMGMIDPLIFKGKTSEGIVSGSISLPDTIQAVSLSNTQRIQLGQSFTLSWSGSNADFYEISVEYEWKDTNGNWYWVGLDTMIIGNSITYNGSIFTHNGKIYLYNISPANGPVPEAGAEANMTGDGTGFLFYYNKRFDIDTEIQVGTGLQKSSNILKTNRLKNEIGTRFKLLKRLGLSCEINKK